MEVKGKKVRGLVRTGIGRGEDATSESCLRMFTRFFGNPSVSDL